MQVLGYRRVKRFTHETLGVFPLEYPPQILETSGYWCSVLPEAQALLEQVGKWRDSVNDYGPNWKEQRQQRAAAGRLPLHQVRQARSRKAASMTCTT